MPRPLLASLLRPGRGPGRRIPTRHLVPMVIAGFLATASFSFLATGFAGRLPEERRWLPWIPFAIGGGAALVLQQLTTREMRQRLENERDERAASEIQSRLRPEVLPQPPGCELAGFYRSYRQIGGDYYDAMMLDDRRLLLAMADVSGKGAAAALLTANLQAILRFLDLGGRSLAAVVAAMNVHLCRHSEPERFITLWLGILDLDASRLVYVNAGHLPALVHGPRGMQRLAATGAPLGAVEGLRFAEAEVTLEPGDVLVLYTDGLSEQRNRGGQFFDEGGIVRALERDGHGPAAAVLERLVAGSREFADGVPADDDTAILVLRVTGAPPAPPIVEIAGGGPPAGVS